MPFLHENAVHPIRTARRQLQYLFTTRHHGGDATASRWLPEFELDEEFSIFDMADAIELADETGNLYGLLVDPTIGYRRIGTCKQQIALFPVEGLNSPWHGYPLFPVDGGPKNRQGLKCRPPKSVIADFQAKNIVTEEDAVRLLKGDHI